MAIIFIKTVILSVIEGLTEFIPVSSTAHLLLAGKLLGLPDSPLVEAFSVSIQSGAILAAVWYFWSTVWNNRTLIPKVIVGFIPTGIAGVLLYPLIKPFFASTTSIALALVVGGILLIAIRPKDTDAPVTDISYKDAFLIGVVQIFSFIPGVSRAGATLIGGTLLGIPRQTIVIFSFLLGIPTILGASFIELRHTNINAAGAGLFALGAVIAFVVALWSIKYFIRILTTKPLSWFGWYRILVGILVLLFL